MFQKGKAWNEGSEFTGEGVVAAHWIEEKVAVAHARAGPQPPGKQEHPPGGEPAGAGGQVCMRLGTSLQVQGSDHTGGPGKQFGGTGKPRRLQGRHRERVRGAARSGSWRDLL